MRIFAFCVALFGLSLPVLAQENQAIEDVIGSQLEAFNDRDVQEAWGFASPMIQGLFGTPGNFGTMVENGYPMVWTNKDVEFLELDDEDGILIQRVLIRDAENVAYILAYAMIETPDGWRINGVQVLPAPDVAA